MNLCRHYEGGTVRIAIATPADAAPALGTSVEALIGGASVKTSGKREPAPRIQQQLEKIEACQKPISEPSLKCSIRCWRTSRKAQPYE